MHTPFAASFIYKNISTNDAVWNHILFSCSFRTFSSLPFPTIRRLNKFLFILNKFEFALENVCMQYAVCSVHSQSKIILFILHFSIFASFPFTFDRILNDYFLDSFAGSFSLITRSTCSMFNTNILCSIYFTPSSNLNLKRFIIYHSVWCNMIYICICIYTMFEWQSQLKWGERNAHYKSIYTIQNRKEIRRRYFFLLELINFKLVCSYWYDRFQY